MFLCDLELYSELVHTSLHKLGETKTRQIFHTSGYIQGKFAVEYFKNKFSIFISKGDFGFYLEQVQSVGLGYVKYSNVNPKNNEVTIRIIHSLSNLDRDYYLEGLFLGVLYAIFNIQYEIKSMKKETYNESIYVLTPSDKIKLGKEEINYSYKNLSSDKQNAHENQLFKLLSSKNKRLFYTDIKGTFFNNVPTFFTLLSVLCLWYGIGIKTSKEFKKIILNCSHEQGKRLGIRYSSLCKSTQDYTQIFSLYGFPGIEIKILNSKELCVKFTTKQIEKYVRTILNQKNYDYSLHKSFIEGFLNTNKRKLKLKSTSPDNCILRYSFEQ
jgi:hypothetical protein